MSRRPRHVHFGYTVLQPQWRGQGSTHESAHIHNPSPPRRLVARAPGGDARPAILHISTEPTELEVLQATEPTEQSTIEHFAARLDLQKYPLLTTVLDSVVDRAVKNQPLHVEPLVAHAALARLLDKLDSWGRRRLWHDGEQEFPHLANGARRLFLRTGRAELPGKYAAANEAVHEKWEVGFEPRYHEVREMIEANLWDGDPLSHFELVDDSDALWPNRALKQAMTTCALRFDGYRYREDVGGDREEPSGDDGVSRSLAVTKRLEEHADYELHCPFDLLTSFFLLQRWLHKWGGEQSAENAASRRVYLELFIVTHDIYVPRKWSMRAVDPSYYAWRWAYAPVARPYVQLARQRLESVDFVGPQGNL